MFSCRCNDRINGEIISQVLMGAIDSQDANSMCGVSIDSSSWSESTQYGISVKGTEDGKDSTDDASQTRSITLSVVKYSGGVEQCRTSFASPQVGMNG